MSNENKLSTAPAGAVAQKTAGGGALSVFADGASFNTALRMAQCLASSTVVPKEYHGNVGNCMIAIEMASRLNTSPMMVMQNLYIVNGRPAWSSQWIIAMINSSRRYKTELQFEFGRDKADGGLSCRAWAEDYSGHKVYGPKITMNMANDEGWTSKNGSKWKTMPDVMIQYRAASFFGRMNCPDMITFGRTALRSMMWRRKSHPQKSMSMTEPCSSTAIRRACWKRSSSSARGKREGLCVGSRLRRTAASVSPMCMSARTTVGARMNLSHGSTHGEAHSRSSIMEPSLSRQALSRTSTVRCGTPRRRISGSSTERRTADAD